ncbi:MAG: hypothetical protein K5695_12640 [Oscillospiraceae bacterium]|nr:hypothetical protein [Oscillospiraceae bacterium]
MLSLEEISELGCLLIRCTFRESYDDERLYDELANVAGGSLASNVGRLLMEKLAAYDLADMALGDISLRLRNW